LDWAKNNTNVSDRNLDSVTTDGVVTFDLYDENATYNETTGEIDNSVTMVQNVSLGANETISVGASADVDFKPDTYNKQSRGRWVNVTMEVPHDEVNVSDVNLSSVRLNDEVAPVTNNRYGFVRNPVSKDTLKVRFPRDEVSEVLDIGENVTIYITGETNKQEMLAGLDEVRVINRPGNRTPPQCSPRDSRGPPDEVPGQDPPNGTHGEGPGQGPGERVGPSNGTYGQGPPDNVPGRGPPECSGNDDEESEDDEEEENGGSEETNASSSDEGVDERRGTGRGQEAPREDRSSRGRENMQSGTDRGAEQVRERSNR